jgi:hypothetical protein
MVPIITIAELISKNMLRLNLTMGFPLDLFQIIIKRISPRKPPKILKSSTNEKAI